MIHILKIVHLADVEVISIRLNQLLERKNRYRILEKLAE